MHMSLFQEFAYRGKKESKYQLGTLIATSLTGFIFGAIGASIIWYVALKAIIGYLS